MPVKEKKRELSDEFWSLAEHADDLHRLCEGALPWPDKVLMALDEVSSDNAWEGNRTPEQKKIEEAIALFESLPWLEQQRICNGWGYKGRTTKPSEFLQYLKELGEPVERVLRIACSARKCDSVLEEVFDGRQASVALIIKHGTPKRVVLDAMDSLNTVVRKHFEKMIVTNCILDLD